MFGKTHFKWSEPWLYVPRERSGRGWALRLGLSLLLAMIVGGIALFAGGADWSRTLSAAFLTFVALLLILDARYLMRDVWIDAKSFNCFGNAGYLRSYVNIPLGKIEEATILRAQESNRPYHQLQLALDTNDLYSVGIPRRLSLENLAQKLYEINIPVALSEWSPRPAGSRPVTISLFGGNLADPDVGVRKASAKAVISPIASDEKKLFEIHPQIIGALAAGWPLLLGLAAVIGGIVWTISHWNVNPGWQLAAAIILPLVLMYFCLQLVAWWAGPIETVYIIGVARGRLADRIYSKIKSDDDRIVTLSQYTEESCKKQLGMSSDDGFLIADHRTQKLYFEGNKKRWEIPFNSIIEAQVEEFSIGAESENGVITKKWFVHLAFESTEGPQDYYLRLSHERFGAETKAAQQRAEDLLLYLDGHIHA